MSLSISLVLGRNCCQPKNCGLMTKKGEKVIGLKNKRRIYEFFTKYLVCITNFDNSKRDKYRLGYKHQFLVAFTSCTL